MKVIHNSPGFNHFAYEDQVHLLASWPAIFTAIAMIVISDAIFRQFCFVAVTNLDLFN